MGFIQCDWSLGWEKRQHGTDLVECPVHVSSKGRQAGTVRAVSSATTTLAQILHAILVSTILLPLYVQIPCAQQPSLRTFCFSPVCVAS